MYLQTGSEAQYNSITTHYAGYSHCAVVETATGQPHLAVAIRLLLMRCNFRRGRVALVLEHFPGTTGLGAAPPEPLKHPGRPDQPSQCSDLQQQVINFYSKQFPTRKHHLNSITVCEKQTHLEEMIFFANKRSELIWI